MVKIDKGEITHSSLEAQPAGDKGTCRAEQTLKWLLFFDVEVRSSKGDEVRGCRLGPDQEKRPSLNTCRYRKPSIPDQCECDQITDNVQDKLTWPRRKK